MKIRQRMVPLKKLLKLERFLLFQKRSKLLESEKSSPLIRSALHSFFIKNKLNKNIQAEIWLKF